MNSVPSRNDPCPCGSGKKYKHCCLGKVATRSAAGEGANQHIESALQQALAHHQQGRLQEAEQLYRAILQAQPTQAEANHNLGALAVQAGQHAAGLSYLKTALAINPSRGQYALSYAEALLASGQAAEALNVLESAMQRGLNTPAALSLRQKAEAAALNRPAKGEAPTPVEMIQLAALFNRGRYVELENLARALVKRYPDSGLAWKALGISLQGQGKDALSALKQTTEFLPDDPEAHYNLGTALKDLGRLDDSMASFRRALEIKPDFAQAYNNLGIAQRELSQFEDAAASFRRALEIKPDFAEAHNNLGNALKHLGQLDSAVASYRRALEINPGYAEAHSNLGTALQERGRLDESVASFCRALEIKQDYAEAHNNLGVALKDLGQVDAAVASYRRAIEIKPNFEEAHSNLGVALKDLGRLDDSMASFRRALEIKQDYAEAHNNLGVDLQDLGRLDDSMASFRRALEIKPDYAEAHSNLLFIHNYLFDQPAAMLLAEARRFGDLVARQARPYTDWSSVPESDRRLRVGLVSGDLRIHPVGYFVEGVLAALAADAAGRLELIAYPAHFHADALSERIKACCHGWHSAVGLSDESLAQRIRDDGIDILIDLSGHTAHNRLPMFAWKPAPVQASWLGYFATTGVAAMDYLIADPWTLTEAEEAHFTEKIWRLPETRLCFTPPDVDVDVAPLPALSNGYITFGCFNNLTKMNDAVVALWARVLLAVPESRLFLKTKQLGETTVRQGVVSRFAAHGIGADRLILEGSAPRSAYLSAYHRVDIALDPFPFPGGTVSAEGLWMGVPVLTLAGERFLSRQGVGLLMNVGLPEWIAADADAYVASAASHAGNLQRLAKLRNGLRRQVLESPLFDAPRFARHFESALRGMWTQWCNQQRGQPPLAQATKKTLLNVGAGHRSSGACLPPALRTPEWKEIRLDIDPTNEPDVLGTMLDMSAVPAESVDVIYSSHTIEHLYPNEIPTAMKEFLRVLRPEGFVVITCPDLQAAAQMIAEDKMMDMAYSSPAGPVTPFDIVYSHRKFTGRDKPYMAHHCGFTLTVLLGTLKANGFPVSTGKRTEKTFALWVIAAKEPLSDEALKELARRVLPS